MVRLFSRATALVAIAATTLFAGAGNVSASDSDEFNQALFITNDVWINEVGTLLYNDLDRDGYFSGISMSFDADAAFNHFEVFIAIDIISEFSPAEILVERLHTTRPFFINGRSITDEYHVEIDLLQNFLPAGYDLRVTLADAHSREILDQVGASDFRNLRALPLESADNQPVSNPVVPIDNNPANQVPNDDIRVVESAGSGGPLFIAMLVTGLLLRCKKNQTLRDLNHS